VIKVSKKDRIKDLVSSLNDLRKTDEDVYRERISLYINMRDGGDGGLFRETDRKIRELHFKNWKDSDFQVILEELSETPHLSEDEWNERFASEPSPGILSKIFKIFS